MSGGLSPDFGRDANLPFQQPRGDDARQGGRSRAAVTNFQEGGLIGLPRGRGLKRHDPNRSSLGRHGESADEAEHTQVRALRLMQVMAIQVRAL